MTSWLPRSIDKLAAEKRIVVVFTRPVIPTLKGSTIRSHSYDLDDENPSDDKKSPNMSVKTLALLKLFDQHETTIDIYKHPDIVAWLVCATAIYFRSP
jgi:hypothetical protein